MLEAVLSFEERKSLQGLGKKRKLKGETGWFLLGGGMG